MEAQVEQYLSRLEIQVACYTKIIKKADLSHPYDVVKLCHKSNLAQSTFWRWCSSVGHIGSDVPSFAKQEFGAEIYIFYSLVYFTRPLALYWT